MRPFLDEALMEFLDNPLHLAGLAVALLAVVLAFAYRRPVCCTLRLAVKGLRRKPLRTTLTGLATAVLVCILTLIWSLLAFLDDVTGEKAKDLKAIVTEHWNIPSQMPASYVRPLAEGAARRPGDVRPEDYMSWSYFGGSTDPHRPTRENTVYFFCTQPEKVPTMFDGVEDFTPAQKARLEEACRQMARVKNKVLIGRERLAALNKRVGERFTVCGTSYKGIDLEVEVVGELPPGRYGASAVMNCQYLADALDYYKRSHGGESHPLADRSVNLVWLKVPDTEAFNRISGQIMESAEFKAPAVKCETASSGIASWLDGYRGLIWCMQWLLSPVILITLSMVLAIAVSFGVLERREEMALLKVLGFTPNRVLCLVVLEAVLLGAVAGFLASGSTYLSIRLRGGLPFRVAFFPSFHIPWHALWWGPACGGATGLFGSLVPGWLARSVKVAEVFSRAN
jgi:putative ABC transport system permease protein